MIRRTTLSTEYVAVPISLSDFGGATVDPTTDTVEMAFSPGAFATPAEDEWNAADWVTEDGEYFARCLVGPAGVVALDEALYSIWVRVTASPELLVDRGGELLVSDRPSRAVAFATVDEFAEFLSGSPIPDDKQARAQLLLELASAAIQDAVHQTLAYVADDEVTLPGVWGSSFELPERPVVSVSKVLLAQGVGVSGVETAFTLLPGGRVVSGASLLFCDDEFAGSWGGPNSVVTVTYTHGFIEVPGFVKAVCMAAAARVWVNPAGVETESVGVHRNVYGGAGSQSGAGLGSVVYLTQDEIDLLTRKLGRTMASVPT